MPASRGGCPLSWPGCWARCWTLLFLRAPAPTPDAVLVGYLDISMQCSARRLFRRTPIVLDHLVSAADGLRPDLDVLFWRFRQADALDRPGRAAVGFRRRCRHRRAPRRAAVVGFTACSALVGAGAQWFAAGAARSASSPGPLRVIFVGLFTPLHGTSYLGEALASLADEPDDATMVGTGQDYAACRAAAAANSVRPLGRLGHVFRIAGAGRRARRVARHLRHYVPRRTSCRPRSSRVRPRRARSSPSTLRHSAGCSATTRCSYPRGDAGGAGHDVALARRGPFAAPVLPAQGRLPGGRAVRRRNRRRADPREGRQPVRDPRDAGDPMTTPQNPPWPPGLRCAGTSCTG